MPSREDQMLPENLAELCAEGREVEMSESKGPKDENHQPHCGGTGFVLYNPGPNQAGESCPGCPNCEPKDKEKDEIRKEAERLWQLGLEDWYEDYHKAETAAEAGRCEIESSLRRARSQGEEAANARWLKHAQRYYEHVRSDYQGFPDLASFVIHEIWKRDPRVDAARKQGEREGLLRAAEEIPAETHDGVGEHVRRWLRKLAEEVE